MKNLCIFILLFSLSLSLSSFSKDNNAKNEEVEVIGDITDQARTRSLSINPIIVFQTESAIEVNFIANVNLKMEVYNEVGNLIYSTAVNNYNGQTFYIYYSNWNIGKYKIIFTNLSNNKTAFGEFEI
ncbi:hypothetical protein M2451_003946 [Dysgonomonas sp. PFB1-18]|uniref:DUF3244 domain-containing protein n=1 Tax=unclassified Dysgonomonas TaxID=2630389 RepID=UPI002475D36E|nr:MULTISPECIES: DUF3244 domain-containing protein [unclassified Dysgonomonas]MDH6311093.1 hypothetical protein [Dysgonomonas sp. PF1-14]MDH6340952.1 hypothetical protein [Dysgonomonas sp. PF1-16]MDH6382601.1 hypothetical protein [Dysgonomonas sp. PFB1-18]MDH6399958.1 hypothetical protein [Dysgonomonas sp. PF1-23]